jgi:hypothetical protein
VSGVTMVAFLPIFISAMDYCKGKLKVPHRLQVCEHSVTSTTEYKYCKMYTATREMDEMMVPNLTFISCQKLSFVSSLLSCWGMNIQNNITPATSQFHIWHLILTNSTL